MGHTVATFNKEKDIVETFSVMVKTSGTFVSSSNSRWARGSSMTTPG